MAYPRFRDIYAEAGVGTSYGRIEDGDGSTFRRTLALARQSHAPVIQLATWNDYGEGTVIEPTKEFGYRDLMALGGASSSTTLGLPGRLFALRKRGVNSTEAGRIFEAIRDGKLADAERRLAKVENH